MWYIINCVSDELTDMREWLSGIASPCQGEGRGFDPRLALLKKAVIQKCIAAFLSLIPDSKGSVFASLQLAHLFEVRWTSCALSHTLIFLPGN